MAQQEKIHSRVTQVRAFSPSLADMGRRSELFPGLGFATAWYWAAVTAEDGTRYTLLREHGLGETVLFFALEASQDPWAAPRLRHAPMPGHDQLFWGFVDYRQEGNLQLLTSRNPFYRKMRMESSPAGHRWSEEDWLELTLRPLGQAMRYRCPGAPDDFGCTSQICQVEGRVDGKRVRGFGGNDRMYHEHGINWRTSKGYLHLEELWWVWAGTHADGRQEHGIAIIGRDDFRVGFFHRDGEAPVTVNDLQAEVLWEDKNGVRLPMSARISFGGRTFQYRATGNVTLSGADPAVEWLQGEMLEEGGPVPAERFCWLEFFKHIAASKP